MHTQTIDLPATEKRTRTSGAAFEIEGADGALAIEPGEYYFNTKARGRRMMKDSLSSDARQVHACLELATMGFQQELAVTMEGGKRRYLTPGDISRQTGLSRQNVRRGFEELEAAGYAERRSDDDGPLRKGHVRLYSWAIPRPSKITDCSRARLQFPASFPASWEPLKPLIRRLKLSFPADFVVERDYIQEGEQALADYKNAEIVVVEFLKRVCAQPPLYKEERTERTERTDSVPESVNEELEAGRQASIEAPAACLPALAELRPLFPDELLKTEDLESLNADLQAEIGEPYDPGAFVAFVARRHARRPFRPGLVFDRGGLPKDFIELARQIAHPASHRAAAAVPDHLLPNSILRLRGTVRDAEEYCRRRPDDEQLRQELQEVRSKLRRTEEEYGLK